MKSRVWRTSRIFLFVIMSVFVDISVVQASPYKLDKRSEIHLLVGASALGIAGLFADMNKETPTPQSLSALDKHSIPWLDRYNTGFWNPTAQHISDAVLGVSMLTPTVFLFKEKEDFLTLGLMYAETLALTLGGTSVAKGNIIRYRPFTYGSEAPLTAKLDADATRSFFSGHAATISASLIFSATVFSDYYPQSQNKKLVWGGAIIGIAAGSWLRVEGGKHFLSDVITGILWGTTVGYNIPRLHRTKETPIQLTPFRSSDVFGLNFSQQF
ncbi:MAG: phosphatase PAP2 family protein [Gammaproteobacteria bacterium]|nr:phosphatase PAP2 family protein [Gammaproteobacteria bacterium]